uniref:Diguanylate cyclase/phosphodiesterase n=1 Tax=Rhodopseudomonas palustris (strain BisA53) TaxID=316055 RepID=Q07PV4_RHOP5
MSIRARLLVLVVGAALLPAIFMGWRYYQDRGKDIEIAKAGLTVSAHAIAATLDAKIQGTAQLHYGLAQARILSDRDKAACSKFLAEVREKKPQYTGILTIDPDGSLYCDSLRTGRSLDLRDRDYFKRALDTAGSIILEPTFGRLTGAAVLQIAYPARDEFQQLAFVLLASLDLDKFLKEQTRDLPPGGEILLVDRNGTVLVGSSARPGAAEPGGSIAASELFRFAAGNAGGTRELADAAGETTVWTVAETQAIGGVNLYVIAGHVKSDLVAAPNLRLAEDMAVLAVFSLLLIAGVWLLAEIGIRSQLGRIAKLAERIAAGDLSARILPPFPKGELGNLMSLLNGAADSIQTQRRDIEHLNIRLLQSQQLEKTERERLDIAISNITRGLLMYDADGRLVVCNRQYIEMHGLSPEVVKPGLPFCDLMAYRKQIGSFDGDVEEFCSSIRRNLADGKISRYLLETGDGRSIESVTKPLPTGGWLVMTEDVTQRRLYDERIAHMAHYDALTDLPNRVLFHERLESALDAREPDDQLAVFYIDIDQFKSVNDSLGHSIGDELLKIVADRLRGCLAATDFAARIGGDEFAIIQTAVAKATDTTDLVERIYAAIRKPYDCAGHLLTADASIGIALAPQHGANLDQLLKNADLAMYGAKAEGRRTYRFFEPAMEARVIALRTMEIDLRQAIADGGFEIYYQPQLRLCDDKVTGCEALLRWRHPVRGMISPAEFIPVAEETGLINQLGEWVLVESCAEAVKWPGDVKVSVNVSPVQFGSEGFALKVAAALANSGLPAHRLELEITEAVLIRDDEAALTMLHQIRALGVGIALDDFGTGYSSLSYLRRFPFDKIKIDRSFIKNIEDANGSAHIVKAVVDIAAAQRMTTTAEGVETEGQLNELRRLGCSEMQGYLYSPPVPASKLAALLLPPDRRLAGAA